MNIMLKIVNIYINKASVLYIMTWLMNKIRCFVLFSSSNAQMSKALAKARGMTPTEIRKNFGK